MQNINLIKLRADLRAIEEQIRPVKEALRSTWTKPMADEQYDLIRLRREATRLLCLLAWARGKSHIADKEKNDRIAEHAMAQYQVEAA